VPHETTSLQLPCGARIRRIELSGTLSREEVGALVEQMRPGGDLHGMPLLVLLQGVDSFPWDARSTAGQAERAGAERWEAVVVTNPVLRVTVNFILRIQRMKKTKLFSGEAEALQWLDARIREDLAASPGAPPE
jgi:hypothetical protein